MERSTIIILCVAFIIFWMLVKRLAKRPKRPLVRNRISKQEQQFDLDRWFGKAQDIIGLMASDQREKLESEWRDMGIDKQLVLADEFLRKSNSTGGKDQLSSNERLRVGWAYFVSGLKSH